MGARIGAAAKAAWSEAETATADETVDRLSRRLIIFGLTALVAFLVVTLILASVINAQLEQAHDSEARIARAYEARNAVRQTYSILQEVEISSGSYLETRYEGALAPYLEAVVRLPAELAALAGLVRDDPVQRARADRFAEAAAALLESAEALTRNPMPGEATAQVRTIAESLNRARGLANVMLASENGRLARLGVERDAEHARAHAYLLGLIAINAGIVLFAVLLSAVLVRRRERLVTALRAHRRSLTTQRRVAERVHEANGLPAALGGALEALGEGLAARAGVAVHIDEATGAAVSAARFGDPVGAAALAAGLDARLPALRADPEPQIERNPGADEARLAVPVVDEHRLAAVLVLAIDGDDGGAAIIDARHAAARLARAAERERIYSRLLDLVAANRAVGEAVPDCLAVVGESGTIDQMNPAGLRMFGLTEAEAAGRRFDRLFAGTADADDPVAWLRPRAPGATAQRSMVTGRRCDGSTFPAEMLVTDVRMARRHFFFVVLIDRTEQIRIERMKSEFVATVSHELRTPLTSIAGSLGLLDGDAAGALPEKARRLVAIAHANALRLVRLINDILDIEKIEAGRLVMTRLPLSIRALLAEVADANRGFADGYGVTIALAEDAADATVAGDHDRLVQVFTNLVSNAVKHSPPGGVVTIAITAAPETVTVGVRDRGAGIPEDFRPRIFEKFAQADASDARRRGGTGLGLAITREIVRHHGGRIEYETAAGQGTEFRVTLPVAGAAPAGAAPEPPAPPRVLLYSAPGDAGDRIVAALLEAGFALDRADSAADAIRLAQDGDYAAVVLDDDAGEPAVGADLLARLAGRASTGAAPLVVVPMNGRDGGAAAGRAVSDRAGRALASASALFGAGAGERPRVLHVDDDPDVRQVVAAALGDRAAVTSVDSLAAARQAVAATAFDAVVLDIGLGDGSGFDLLPDLERGGRATPPVVVFSAQDPKREIAFKVDAYLTKSRASLDALVEVVGALCRRAAGRGDGRPP